VKKSLSIVNRVMVKKLKSLFGSSSQAGANQKSEAFPWIPLEGPDQLERLLGPGERPGVIFKHSTRCGLSGMMLRRFQQNWDQARDRADFYLLDLVSHRELSNQIADRLEIPHQSPQVLILEGGQVRAHDSHGGIDRLRPEPESKNPA
jgi:bacillithiol system protein YtxJ